MSKKKKELPVPPDNVWLDPILAQQRTESHKAYGYWIFYRDTPRTQRSLRGTARHFEVSMTNMWKISQRWQWKRRLAAWENHINYMMLADLWERGQEANDRHIQAARMMILKGVMKVKDLDPSTWTTTQALRYIVEGVRIEREAYGLQTQVKRKIEVSTDEVQDVEIQEVTGFILGDSHEEDSQTEPEAEEGV